MCLAALCSVLFVRVSEWSLRFMRVWSHALLRQERCQQLRTRWPGDQGCLQVLLRDLPWHDRQRVSLQPMAVLNGPWGQFIRHLFGEPWLYDKWGETWLSKSQPGGGASLVLIDELHRHGVWSRAQYQHEAERLERGVHSFQCTASNRTLQSEVGGQRRPRPPGSCSSRRQPWRDILWPLWNPSWNRSDVLGAPPGVPQASAELARRVQASKDSWWGTTDKRVSFRAQGLLRTPWGAGTWGVLPDAPGKLFATFGGADHELSFEAWPAFVSTRCSDGDVVHGIMSRVRV